MDFTFLFGFFFLPLFLIGQCLDRKLSGEEREGGWDLERSASQDLNSGHPKRNNALCRRISLLNTTRIYFISVYYPY